MKPFYLLLITTLLGLASISVIVGQSKGNSSFTVNRAQASPYEVSGNRNGQVVVRNTLSGEVIRTFQMGKGVVREVFLLRGGKTVAASQGDRAVFWDLSTGQEINRLEQRIYGFSHDETKFFTYDSGKVILYSYPQLEPICELTNNTGIGPEWFRFSPDDRFLVILFATGRPESDEYYPGLAPLRRSIRYSRLFELKTCQEIQEFSKLRVIELGEFSSDSYFYNLRNTPVLIEEEGRYIEGSWQYNLVTNKIQIIN
jgi:hypothetical protein